MIGPAQESLLAERGWLVVDLPDARPVLHARRLLLDHLREVALPSLSRLDDYHRHVEDDRQHAELLRELTAYYWSRGLGRAIVERNLEVFHVLVGRDLHMQRRPTLRAARPDNPDDAIELRRETSFGASPYEVAVLVPFTDVDATGGLRVVSRSHLAADADVRQLGLPYGPDPRAPVGSTRAEAIPLRTGQVLLFCLALVQGSGVNGSGRTRVSTEIRIVNSLAPAVRERDPSFYGPLCVSPASHSAWRYLDSDRAMSVASGMEDDPVES
jgi:hypothetical protein